MRPYTIFWHIPDTGACTLYRSVLPLRFLRNELAAAGVELIPGVFIAEKEKFDAVCFQRGIPDQLFLHLVERHAAGTKVWWALDDDFWTIPDWSPVKTSVGPVALYDRMRHLCDLAIVSTVPLAERVGSKAVVCPNLIDPQPWGELRLTPEPTEGEPIRVLWAGSNTHARDLAVLVEPLTKLSQKYGAHLQLHFVGQSPPELVARLWPGPLIEHEWVGLHDYPKLVRHLAPHIAVCPLAPCAFNHSKSNIKALEMTLAGAAVVCSDEPAYQDFPAAAHCRTSEQWFAEMDLLVSSPRRRQRCWETAVAAVQTRLSWESAAARQQWLKPILAAAQRQPATEEEQAHE